MSLELTIGADCNELNRAKLRRRKGGGEDGNLQLDDDNDGWMDGNAIVHKLLHVSRRASIYTTQTIE